MDSIADQHMLHDMLMHRTSSVCKHAIRSDGIPKQALRQRSHYTTVAISRPRVIFSGIQPTGVPHLGNYLGALRQWKKLQDEDDTDTTLLFSLVDLHAVTIRQAPEQLRRWKRESYAMLLAIGLDPGRSIIYHQSKVREHAHLMWLLSCESGMGHLERMTQWKEKTSSASSKENSERLKLGLFSYPVLQAADVLLYQTTHVPVGHDQAQHLELARQIANAFNSVFGAGQQVLTPPETIISPARRVMSLTEPSSKMSKSHPNSKSRILLTDSAEVVNAKLKGAVTDSLEGITYDPEPRPGVSNLIDMLYHVKYEDSGMTKAELAKDFETASLRVLKETVAAAVNHMLDPIRETYQTLIKDEAHLDELAQLGADRASKLAQPTITQVEKVMGLD